MSLHGHFMKILIIGSTSFVGKSLGKRLKKEGHNVKFAGRRSADITLDLNLPIYELEVNESFDVVVLAAADFSGNTTEDMIRTESINAVGVIKVCDLCNKVNAKHFVLLSTIFVHFNKDDCYYNSYSISKRHGEELASFYCKKNNIPLTIIRPSQVYDSEGEARKHQAFLYTILDKVAAGQDITIYGSIPPIRNYIHIDDLTEILKIIITRNILGEFDCVSPYNFNLSEIIDFAYSVWEKKGEVFFLPEMDNLPNLEFAFDESLARLTNYRPKVSFEEGFIRYKKYLENTK